MMDIKKIIDDVVGKLKGDPDLLTKFNDQPVKTVESIVGIDLPDDQVEPVVSGIKAKIGGGIGGIVDKITGLFGGKKD